MKGWLLDTNVLSELRKPKPNSKLLSWLGAQAPQHTFVSTIALAEIALGIEMQTDPNLRENLSHWLEDRIRPAFEGRTIEVGEGELVTWRLMAMDIAKRRTSVPEPDLLIAAVARHNKLAVATRNAKDFVETGVSVVNPFTGERFNVA